MGPYVFGIRVCYFMGKIKNNSLYLIITEEYGRGRSAAEIAKKAIAGGVDMIQMREKNRPREELIKIGKSIAALCGDKNVTFIVNDNPLLAKELGADGVHLGQEDMKLYPINKVRKLIGKNKIVGLSTHSLDQLAKANEDDCDYIAFGPIFPTKTKDYSIGTKDVRRVLEIAGKPVFFIGGINLSNIDTLLGKGAKNIAVIRAMLEADDIKTMAEDFKCRLTENRKERVRHAIKN